MNIPHGRVNTDKVGQPTLVSQSRLLAILVNLLEHLKYKIPKLNDNIYHQPANTIKINKDA